MGKQLLLPAEKIINFYPEWFGSAAQQHDSKVTINMDQIICKSTRVSTLVKMQFMSWQRWA